MTRRAPAIAVVLALPTAAFGLVVRWRNAWYDRPGAAKRATVPVVSVGNLAMGGTGKTPLVAWIARRLKELGVVPAVVSRGYGGSAGPGPLVVSTGDGPRINARTSGDEPHLLARSLEGAIVVVGSDRIEGARCAAAAGAGVVVLDDGFQHRRLARDLDVVVLDGRAPFGDGNLLPKGDLREPPAALARAHVVVLTRLREDDAAEDAMRAVRDAGYAGPIVRAGHRATGFRDASGKPCAAPSRAVAFCGIGDPELFRADLESSGVALESFHAFRDHHPYSLAEWTALAGESRAKGAPLVTTEKDLSRLDGTVGGAIEGSDLCVLEIEAVPWDEAPLLDALRKVVTTPREGTR